MLDPSGLFFKGIKSKTSMKTGYYDDDDDDEFFRTPFLSECILTKVHFSNTSHTCCLFEAVES